MLYRTFNKLRNQGGNKLTGDSAAGMMEQYLRHVVSGSDVGTSFICHCWNPRYRIMDYHQEDDPMGGGGGGDADN